MSQAPRRVLMPVTSFSCSALFDWFMNYIYKDRDDVILLYVSDKKLSHISKAPVSYLDDKYLTKLTGDNEEKETQLMELLQEIFNIHCPHQIKGRVLRVFGENVGQTICQQAKDHKMDVIIMASASLVQRNPTNSTAMYVAHNSKMPVIMYKHNKF